MPSNRAPWDGLRTIVSAVSTGVEEGSARKRWRQISVSVIGGWTSVNVRDSPEQCTPGLPIHEEDIGGSCSDSDSKELFRLSRGESAKLE